MNKIITSVVASLFIGTALFAQEEQVEKAKEALESGDLVKAKSLIHEVKITDENSYSFDPELVSDYLFVRGNICKASGEKNNNDNALINAAKTYSKLSEFEKGYSYSAKNKETGEYEFFKDKAALDAAEASGNYKKFKSKEIKNYHSEGLSKTVGELALKFYNGAMESYSSKDYDKSSKLFEGAYELYDSPILGGNADTTLLYNSAMVAVSGKDYDRGIKLYQKLIDIDYTGITTIYQGVDKASGKKKTYASKSDLKTQMKLGLVENDSIYTTKNMQPSIYRSIGAIYLNMGDAVEGEKSPEKKAYYDQALHILKEGKNKFPGDYDLLLTLGNTYLKEGDHQGFVSAMRQAVQKDPTNPVLYYNIGVVSADLGMSVEAKAAYIKAIELKPDYTDAYVNLSALILHREKEINDEISALPIKLNSKNRAKLKNLKSEKIGVYKEAIGYLEGAYEHDKESVALLQTMKGIYYALDRNDDFMRVKKELDAIKAK